MRKFFAAFVGRIVQVVIGFVVATILATLAVKIREHIEDDETDRTIRRAFSETEPT